MDINEVKNKIKKLLTLHEDGGASDHESYVALQKAQELMARYKIEMGDIKEEEKNCIQKKTTMSYGSRSSDHYMNELANVIAENFCCVSYMSTPRGTRTHCICFMGMEDDVSIAEEVLYSANSAIVRGYNRVYKELCSEYDMDYIPAKYFNPAKEGYVNGYIDGLKYALESQKEQHQEWGLVLVVPQEAKSFLDGLKVKNFGQVVTFVDNTYYNEGYSDGSNFHLNKKLDTNKVRGELK